MCKAKFENVYFHCKINDQDLKEGKKEESGADIDRRTLYYRGLKHAARGPHVARQRCLCGPRLSFKQTKLEMSIIEGRKMFK